MIGTLGRYRSIPPRFSCPSRPTRVVKNYRSYISSAKLFQSFLTRLNTRPFKKQLAQRSCESSSSTRALSTELANSSLPKVAQSIKKKKTRRQSARQHPESILGSKPNFPLYRVLCRRFLGWQREKVIILRSLNSIALCQVTCAND